jgi:hypothetical protein
MYMAYVPHMHIHHAGVRLSQAAKIRATACQHVASQRDEFADKVVA